MKSKSAVPAQISNCRRGLLARGATLVVPAVLSLIAMAGVATGPALELGDRKLALRAARARVEQCDSARVEHARHTESNSLVVATAALSKLRELVPEDCPPLVAHGLVRTASALCGLPIDVIQVGPERELGLDGPSDVILAREVTIAGKAGIDTVLALVSTLRGLGFPTAVFGIALVRERPSQPEFEYRIDLGLLHYAPLPAAAEPDPQVQSTPEELP